MTRFLLCILFCLFLVNLNCQEKQPNILFIISDDQDAETLDVYAQNSCDTPVIDNLSKSGISFTSAYHMGAYRAAVCTPSRIMLMTGRNLWETDGYNINYPPLNYVHDFKKNYSKITPESPEYYSMPAIFKRAGYYTFRTSKRGNSFEGANLLFEERYDRTNREGDDLNGNAWHAQKVIDYIEKRTNNNATKKPFLIYLGFSHPHDPRRGKIDLLKKYGAQSPGIPKKLNNKLPPLPVNYLPNHPFPHGHQDVRDENLVEGVMTQRNEIVIRNEKGKDYACIEDMDYQIGRVIEALKLSGEIDNTYIFFTSDHGIAIGKHGLIGKQNLYEHSWRIPLIVTGPKIKKNKKIKGNIYLSDILPTLCEIAGIDIPKTVDGKSFNSILEGKRKKIRDVMYGAYSGGTKPGIRAIKKNNWKLIKYDVMNGNIQKNQLFNLKNNPNELLIEHHRRDVVEATGNNPKNYQVNLAHDPKFKRKLKKMEKLLFEKMVNVGDPYKFWNQEQTKN